VKFDGIAKLGNTAGKKKSRAICAGGAAAEDDIFAH